jgi:hypothetical protein
MELRIYKNTSAREAKEQFRKFFPFLKLEFFAYYHQRGEESHINKEAFNGTYLSETSDFFKEGVLNFSPSTTVAEFELEFQVELGLVAKIYRKTGDLWVDTSQTSHLTLGKQNSMAAALSRPIQSNKYTLLL